MDILAVLFLLFTKICNYHILSFDTFYTDYSIFTWRNTPTQRDTLQLQHYRITNIIIIKFCGNALAKQLGWTAIKQRLNEYFILCMKVTMKISNVHICSQNYKNYIIIRYMGHILFF